MNRLTLRRISDVSDIEVTGLPENPIINTVMWSPDSKQIAFLLTVDNRMVLWTAAVDDGKAAQLSDLQVNAAFGAAYTWLSDGKTIIAKTVPEGRGEPPQEPTVPSGPTVQENLGRKTPAPTYQDLLKNAFDESLFDYYATSQLVRIDAGGNTTAIGAPGIFAQVDPSPDGKFILIQTIQPPYSYTVPHHRFPRKVEIWDLSGKVVHHIADIPLADNIPVTFG